MFFLPENEQKQSVNTKGVDEKKPLLCVTGPLVLGFSIDRGRGFNFRMDLSQLTKSFFICIC